MPMPTTSAAPVNTIPRALTHRSRSPGTRAITTAPAAGKKVARVMADCSQPFIRSPRQSSSNQGDGDGHDDHAAEQHGGIRLNLPCLQEPSLGAHPAGDLPHAVDGAVD